MRSSQLALAGFILLGGLAAPGWGAESPAPLVSVQLDMFSGMLNPSWGLSPSEGNELQRRLTGLPAANGAKWPEPALGYRGFTIRLADDNDHLDEAERVQVGFGLVARSGRLFRDTAGIEGWLVGRAREQGHAALIAAGELAARGCGDQSPAPLVLVTLDVFSGLPNPSWALSPWEALELQRRLTDLPAANDATLPEARLGYSGFSVRLQACHEEVQELEIRSGLIARLNLVARSQRLFRDAVGLEDWLIQLAGDHGHAELIRHSRGPAR